MARLMSCRLLVSMLALVALSVSPVRAAEEEAVTVFRQVAPRVVSLENAEGSGTGVIISADGLILTNAHVVSSPLPYTVTVDTQVGGKTKAVVFKKVTIVGFHPKMDLALVKIDPKENNVTLLPAEIAKTKGDAGQRIYAIGNPAAGGHIMTKSITSGMLSAVDREVDGQAYYQIDAAVNPGNSGGPICDKTGKVLGIVTFKFEDVTAMSFAIPLQDLDTKAFLPLSKRKGDPAKAKEYLRLADRYATEADKVAAREGQDSDDRKLLNYYAAVCYRLALTEDPGNAATYYNIGMLLRTLDTEDVAIAYLARAIQLEPWDASNGNPYREFGLCMAKQGNLKDAMIVWREGLAKHPYATKIWEDVAITHEQQKAFEESAYDATVGLAIPDHDARLDVLQTILRESKGKLSAEQSARFEARAERSAMISSLAQALDVSNKARKDRKLAITPEFAALLEKISGPPIAGVPDTISIAPASAPKGMALGDAALPKTPASPPPAKVTKTPAPAPSPDIAAAPKPNKTSTTPAADASKGASGGSSKDWIGAGSSKPTAAVAGDQSFAGKTSKSGAATITTLTPDDVVAMQWSADAHSVFLLQKSGTLSKVSVPEFKEVKHCTIAGNPSSMAVSKSGLLVSCSATDEVWLMSEDLAQVRHFAVPGAGKVISGRAIAYGYVAGPEDRIDGLDLATGNVTELDVGGARRKPGAHLFEITPDGKYIFTEQSNGLVRIRAEGARLTIDETGPAIGGNPQAISISADSAYVALPSGGGNSGIGPRSPYSTYLFKVGDLKTSVATIASGAYPRALGFDSAAHLIYTVNHATQLRVYSPQGELKGDYKWMDHTAGVVNYLVHPDGKKLLVQNDGNVVWVELP